jgi:hypothetical protein
MALAVGAARTVRETPAHSLIVVRAPAGPKCPLPVAVVAVTRRAAKPTPKPGFGVDRHARRWHTTPGRFASGRRPGLRRAARPALPGRGRGLGGHCLCRPFSQSPCNSWLSREVSWADTSRTSLCARPLTGSDRFATRISPLTRRPSSRRGEPAGSADKACGWSATRLERGALHLPGIAA